MKSETRNPIAVGAGAEAGLLRISTFGLRNSFGLRTPDFVIPRASAAFPAGKTRPIFVISTDFFLQPEQAGCASAFPNGTMALSLNKLSSPIPGCLLRKGPRVFALLGKATPVGLAAFSRDDLSRSWAVTAEFGCLRLERLCGDEELTGEQVFLPLPSDYNYGVTGAGQSPEVTRAVFGLLASELEQLVTVLRRGSFPVLGFSQRDQRCSLTCCTIPGYWPHVVTSNMALHGNVVSLETFVRVMVASLPQARLSARFPDLQPVFQQMMKMVVRPRRGILFNQEMVELAPAAALAKAA
jgi:hypothetical protein